MGVAYKAEDIKLKRTVALKFSAPELTSEKEAKEHFILEAQTASTFSIASISQQQKIYSVGLPLSLQYHRMLLPG